MDFSNEVLSKMEDKRVNYNSLYASWLLKMSEEYKYELVAYSKKLERKSLRMKNCLNLWNWDVYHKNKLMDLMKLNRCMNNRFCPNCRKWDLASAIHNFKKPFNKLLVEGYYPYLVTLTIPNIPGYQLKKTLTKMNLAFKKLFGTFSYPLVNATTKGFMGRYMEFEGALKVLEITYNSNTETYHPHFHCLFFSKEYDESLFQKDIVGEYSYKRNSYNYYSDIDIQIARLWTLCYSGKRITVDNYNKLEYEDLYVCDIREMDSAGIVEVLKYTFKDTDVISYDVFKTLVEALENKRIRQGYGVLFDLKVEDGAEGDKLSLQEFLTEDEEENPERLITTKIKELITDYNEYRKISRRKMSDLD